jgi:predicted solute-binding protein
MNTWDEVEQYMEERMIITESYLDMYYRDLYYDLCHERKKQTSDEDDYLYRIGVNDDDIS